MSAAAGLLQGIHAIIAWRTSHPHWMLADPDAKHYGQALANAMRHVPIKHAQKAVDFTMLAVAVITHEGPRIQLEVALRRGTAQPRGPAQVFQFHRQAAAPAKPNGAGEAERPAERQSDVTFEPDFIIDPELGETVN